MRHEDALLVRRLGQNNIPALAMQVYSVDEESGISYLQGSQRVQSTDLAVMLQTLAHAIKHLQPLLYCRGCDAKRPREEFFNYRRGDPTRKQGLCKACSKREHQRRYHKDPEVFRRRDKRYRLQGRPHWRAEWAQRSRDGHRAARLATRLARAELLIELWAAEYHLERAALYGPTPKRAKRRAQAMALLVRTIRAWTYLHPDAIAELLGCSPEDIPRRIQDARSWTHYKKGDTRIRARLARVRGQYDVRCCTLQVERKDYMDYTPAQRLPGRARSAREEDPYETPRVS